MADIGKPLRRYKVIPLTEPVVPTHEPPRTAPKHAPSSPSGPTRQPAAPMPAQPAEPERV